MAARTATSAPGSSAIAASVVILDRANADQGSCQRSSDVSSCRARLSVLDGRTWSCCEGVTSVRVRLKDRANAQQRLKDLANVDWPPVLPAVPQGPVFSTRSHQYVHHQCLCMYGRFHRHCILLGCTGQFHASALADDGRVPLSIAEVPRSPSVKATALRTEGRESRIGTIFEPIGSIRDPQQLSPPLEVRRRDAGRHCHQEERSAPACIPGKVAQIIAQLRTAFRCVTFAHAVVV
jgi:hypothetical protein